MIELGRKQIMYMDHKTDFGVYLTDRIYDRDDRPEAVLLPKKQVPAQLKKGDSIEVFLYKDSDDRNIATTKEPALTLGELAVLPVLQVNKVGAFLGWGLEKDLLLPYKEQTYQVAKGDYCLVTLYVDKSERLCATMKVYDYLRTDSGYKKNDMVTGMVYSINPEFGAFVAVDQKYNAMIPNKELVRKLRIGEEVSARVLQVREDGKLDLSLREQAHVQMDIDSMKIMEKLEGNGGFLPYHDKSAPAEIKAAFGMSKNEFKRAIGRLYKMKKISIETDGIKIQG